jgi:hypothetical protein
VSTTPKINPCHGFSVTGDNFLTGVNDTSEQFIAGDNDTGEQLSPLSLPPVINLWR